MGRIILHIDLNAFFVRCEEIKNPSLEGKPVIIGHKGRGGIVSTCSYAARRYGVTSGMPTFKALALCPNAHIISDDFRFYRTMSRKFFRFVKQYSTLVEPASIDECYVDMTKQLKDVKKPESFLKEMQDKLFLETSLRCSIGVAPTKFLAKMASDMKKPMGITIIRRKDVRKMLDPLPINAFYGIGKKTTPRLVANGIKTIGDLAKLINSNDINTQNLFGKFYYVIKDWINGYGDDIVNCEPFDPKSIGNSHTLMYDTNNYDDLKDNISMLAEEVSQRAIECDKVGSSVQLTLKDNDFKVITRSITLKKPTNDYETINDFALKLLDRNYDDSKMIRLVGVSLQNLINPSEASIQLSLFDNYDELKEEYATKLLIGDLNRKMNKTVFKTAGEKLRENKYENK